MKNLAFTLLLICLPFPAWSADSFKLCWSVYVGWVPWAYAAQQGIVKKWADKFDVSIDVVQVNDYIESVERYSAGEFDACTMTNIEALSIPPASGIDSTALIVGDFSDGNDAVIAKNVTDFSSIKGQKVGLVEFSVSHYLLNRGLEKSGISESDVQLVNTADSELLGLYASDDVSSAVTWKPLLSDFEMLPGTEVVFDSSRIPGEIVDLLVVNTETLKSNPRFGKAVVGAWYETMAQMSDEKNGGKVRQFLAQVSGSNLRFYENQLESTHMFYSPSDAIKLVNSDLLLTTMQRVANFSFKHGMLGELAKNQNHVGIETPAGVFGDPGNVKLRFDTGYMSLAESGKLAREFRSR